MGKNALLPVLACERTIAYRRKRANTTAIKLIYLSDIKALSAAKPSVCVVAARSGDASSNTGHGWIRTFTSSLITTENSTAIEIINTACVRTLGVKITNETIRNSIEQYFFTVPPMLRYDQIQPHRSQ